jgi:phosphopantothenoylcysteine decarboxylase/phosphopantothenate--cysteine ligase
MKAACDRHFEAATVVVAAAAVADYRPAVRADEKVKKAGGPLSLELVRTPDILKGLGERKGGRVLVGFAAETASLEANAAGKLAAKNLDLVVGNDVSVAGQGFSGEANAGIILRRDGGRAEVPLGTKRAMAERILDEVVAVIRARRGAAAPA